MRFNEDGLQMSFTENSVHRRHHPKWIPRSFRGRIVGQTDAAYRIEGAASPSCSVEFWAPKSVTEVLNMANDDPLSVITLEKWWYRAEMPEKFEQIF